MARIIPPDHDPAESMPGKVRRFAQLKTLAADLTKQADILKKELSAWVDAAGYADDKGSKWIDLETPIEGYVALQWQRRVSNPLDADAAETILASQGLTDRCFKMVPALDELEVMQCITDGLLSDDDVAGMFPVKETWAFVPTKDKK